MEIKVRREVFVEKIGRRADAMILATHNNLGYACWVELALDEKEESLRSKERSVKDFQDLPEFFSRLFGVKVPYVDFIVLREGESLCGKLPPLD